MGARDSKATRDEGTLAERVLEWLNGQPHTYAEKTHGNIFSRDKPDIDACVAGRAVKIELKALGEEAKRGQLQRLRKWGRAGARVAVCDTLAAVQGLWREVYEQERNRLDRETGGDMVEDLLLAGQRRPNL